MRQITSQDQPILPAPNKTNGRFPTVGYYAYMGVTQTYADFWKACNIDTIELLDIGWYYNAEKDLAAFQRRLKDEIELAQKNGLKVYVILLTNLEQYTGPESCGNENGVVFDPSDEAKMTKRLQYIEDNIKVWSMADGFSLFAGDPGGVGILGIPGGLDYYVKMGRRVYDLVKQHAPNAEYNLNLWAISQCVLETANPFKIDFWIGEATHARTLIAMDDLFGRDIGVEIPCHDYYRALALRLYSENGAYPNSLFPAAGDIEALKEKNTTRIWTFSHFLLDELDDGDSSGTSRTTLPNFNTRYIYKYIDSIRAVGMNGAIAGNSTLNNSVNLYAFARFANDESATPESVLKDYAKYLATDETYETLFEIFMFLENDANWHQKLPSADRVEKFSTVIESTEQAYELFKTIKVRENYSFDFPESPSSFLSKVGQRILRY